MVVQKLNPFLMAKNKAVGAVEATPPVENPNIENEGEEENSGKRDFSIFRILNETDRRLISSILVEAGYVVAGYTKVTADPTHTIENFIAILGVPELPEYME